MKKGICQLEGCNGFCPIRLVVENRGTGMTDDWVSSYWISQAIVNAQRPVRCGRDVKLLYKTSYQKSIV